MTDFDVFMARADKHARYLEKGGDNESADIITLLVDKCRQLRLMRDSDEAATITALQRNMGLRSAIAAIVRQALASDHGLVSPSTGVAQAILDLVEMRGAPERTNDMLKARASLPSSTPAPKDAV